MAKKVVGLFSFQPGGPGPGNDDPAIRELALFGD
jgi:hypothetical protein